MTASISLTTDQPALCPRLPRPVAPRLAGLSQADVMCSFLPLRTFAAKAV